MNMKLTGSDNMSRVLDYVGESRARLEIECDARSLHDQFEQAPLRRRRERLHEVHTALYPTRSALGPEMSAEAAIRYVA